MVHGNGIFIFAGWAGPSKTHNVPRDQVGGGMYDGFVDYFISGRWFRNVGFCKVATIFSWPAVCALPEMMVLQCFLMFFCKLDKESLENIDIQKLRVIDVVFQMAKWESVFFNFTTKNRDIKNFLTE